MEAPTPRGPKVARAPDHLLTALKEWLEMPVPGTGLRHFDLFDWGTIEKDAGLKTRVRRWFEGQVRDNNQPFRLSQPDLFKLVPYLRTRPALPLDLLVAADKATN